MLVLEIVVLLFVLWIFIIEIRHHVRKQKSSLLWARNIKIGNCFCFSWQRYRIHLTHQAFQTLHMPIVDVNIWGVIIGDARWRRLPNIFLRILSTLTGSRCRLLIIFRVTLKLRRIDHLLMLLLNLLLLFVLLFNCIRSSHWLLTTCRLRCLLLLTCNDKGCIAFLDSWIFDLWHRLTHVGRKFVTSTARGSLLTTCELYLILTEAVWSAN